MNDSVYYSGNIAGRILRMSAVFFKLALYAAKEEINKVIKNLTQVCFGVQYLESCGCNAGNT